MMTFIRIPARDVRPGALLQVDLGTTRIVVPIRDVVERFGVVEFTFADGRSPLGTHYGRADMLWVAQRN